jgi:hypothetical protein
MYPFWFVYFVIMAHECHHKDVREWAKQHHPDQQDRTNGNLEEVDSSQPGKRDQAASQHEPHVFFVHKR